MWTEREGYAGLVSRPVDDRYVVGITTHGTDSWTGIQSISFKMLIDMMTLYTATRQHVITLISCVL